MKKVLMIFGLVVGLAGPAYATDTTVPVKSTGDTLTAAEINNLVDAHKTKTDKTTTATLQGEVDTNTADILLKRNTSDQAIVDSNQDTATGLKQDSLPTLGEGDIWQGGTGGTPEAVTPDPLIVAEPAASTDACNPGSMFPVSTTSYRRCMSSGVWATFTGVEWTKIAVVAPTLSTATVNGTQVNLTFSEDVSTTGYTLADFDLDCSVTGNNIALGTPTGSGAAWAFTAASTIVNGETCTLDFNGATDSVEDVGGTDLAAIVDMAVANNTEEVIVNYDFQERFEGGSYSYDDSTALENDGWSHIDTGVVNNADTSDPLEGTVSALVDGLNAQLITPQLSPGTDGDIYVSWMYRGEEVADCDTITRRFADIEYASGHLAIMSLTRSTNCNITGILFVPYGQSGIPYDTEITNPDTNAKYWKLKYNNGTGTNAEFGVYFSADGDSWTEAITITDGTQTEQFDHIVFRDQGDVSAFTIDDIRVSTSDINY